MQRAGFPPKAFCRSRGRSRRRLFFGKARRKSRYRTEGKIVIGRIGGGCAESAVRQEALKSIADAKPRLITLDLRDELLGVGVPCGGVMQVYIEPALPKPQLLILGHGRIAETLATLAHLTNFSVTIDDPAADQQAFPRADRLTIDDLNLTCVTIDGHRWEQFASPRPAAPLGDNLRHDTERNFLRAFRSNSEPCWHAQAA